MDQLFRESFWKNFAAAIDMFKNIISICPDATWQKEKKIFYMAYHTLLFLDYYLTIPVSSFHPLLPYTIVEPDQLPPEAIDDVFPDQFYPRNEMQTYIAAAREKCEKLIMQTPAEKFSERWIRSNEINRHGLCPAVVTDYNLLEILFYNLRHIQHHVGQLNLLLRQTANIAADWIAQSE
ncbi:hypothetical protein A8C56_05275 [Niabella ginsenosidivorans]|uniref:DinB-like domain-containing protein n=2 Tax=Niabella ginsenosidivorans TaxID=1176587 RepID=A0A1A9I7Z9_9BACT|nr:hypothetical protein A8C56_05275 [Niabella ginsenosidivorans]